MKTKLLFIGESLVKHYAIKYGEGNYCLFKVQDDALNDETIKSISRGDIAIVKLHKSINLSGTPKQCFMGKDRIIEGVGRMIACQFDI